MQNPLGTIRPQVSGLPAMAPYPTGLPRRKFASATPPNNRVGNSGLGLLGVSFTGDGATTFSWTAPRTTVRVEQIVGKGQDGSPGQDYTDYKYDERDIQYHWYASTNTTQQVGTTYLAFGIPGQKPDDYCDSSTTPAADGYTYTCYYFTDASVNYSSDPSNGVGFTAFGYTFPGGIATTAPTLVVDVPFVVQPGETYWFTLPPGATLNIYYYQ